jgi:hypothetical protein
MFLLYNVASTALDLAFLRGVLGFLGYMEGRWTV